MPFQRNLHKTIYHKAMKNAIYSCKSFNVDCIFRFIPHFRNLKNISKMIIVFPNAWSDFLSVERSFLTKLFKMIDGESRWVTRWNRPKYNFREISHIFQNSVTVRKYFTIENIMVDNRSFVVEVSKCSDTDVKSWNFIFSFRAKMCC